MNTLAFTTYQPVGIKKEPLPAPKPTASVNPGDRNDKILLALAAAAFLVFFNAFMVAPLIPALAREFSATQQQVGWLIPAYMLPYGFSTLFYGPLADRLGRRNLLLVLVAFSVLTTLLLSRAWSVEALIVARIIAGLCAGGIVTIGLTVVGDLYPFNKLGRAMGWMFGAIAGGMAFGATFGAWLNPSIGWRNEFVLLAFANIGIFLFLYKHRVLLTGPSQTKTPVNEVVRGYGALLRSARGSKVYTYIFFNGIFHGGVFSWIAFYLTERYGLSDAAIGRALIGYGLPGVLFGPLLGRLADRFGRKAILPAGFLIASATAFLFIPVSPLWFVTLLVPFLSLGLDMTHPLMAGIVASLDPKRRGQAMGLNAFALFTGLGLGAILFQLLLKDGFSVAFAIFGVSQLVLSVTALRAFQAERPKGERGAGNQLNSGLIRVDQSIPMPH